jgi:hypothetical protein
MAAANRLQTIRMLTLAVAILCRDPAHRKERELEFKKYLVT